MTKKSIYTKEQKASIEKLGGSGMPDGEIARIVGVKLHFVTPIVTKYWEEKMKKSE